MSEKSAVKRLYILDSLRGLAAIVVGIHHLFVLNIPTFEASVNKGFLKVVSFISDQNHLAVLFFFVLSGFSIGLSLKNKSLLSRKDINDYLYRRFKRILPIYLLSLFITAIVGVIGGTLTAADYGFGNLMGNLFFLQTSKYAGTYWFSPYGTNGPLWSLAYEMFFYMIFPVIYWFNARYFDKISLILRFSFLFVLSVAAILLNKIIFVPYLAFFSLLIVWIAGYVLSKCYLENKVHHLLFILMTLVACIYLDLSKNSYMSSDSIDSITKGMILAGIFYLVLLIVRSAYARFLELPEKILNRLFLYSGKGSYAFYALHYPLIQLLAKYHSPLILQVAGLIVLVIVSRYLEEYTVRKKWVFLKLNYLPIGKGNGLQNAR